MDEDLFDDYGNYIHESSDGEMFASTGINNRELGIDREEEPVGTPDFSRIYLKMRSGSSSRPTQSYQADYISLITAKNLLQHNLGISSNPKVSIDITFIKESLGGNQERLPNFLMNVICLHLNIMFRPVSHVVRFLYYFTKAHGSMATELLVNYSVQDNILNQFSTNGFNALNVAILWTNSVEMVRILYKFGSDISLVYSNGMFAEELHTYIPYYNHFGNYFIYTNTAFQYNHIWGYRLINDFTDVITQIRIICGEIQHSKDYIFPVKCSYLNINKITSFNKLIERYKNYQEERRAMESEGVGEDVREDDNGNISNDEGDEEEYQEGEQEVDLDQDSDTISPHIRETLLRISNEIMARRENEYGTDNRAHDNEVDNELDNETISNSSDEIEVFI